MSLICCLAPEDIKQKERKDWVPYVARWWPGWIRWFLGRIWRFGNFSGGYLRGFQGSGGSPGSGSRQRYHCGSFAYLHGASADWDLRTTTAFDVGEVTAVERRRDGRRRFYTRLTSDSSTFCFTSTEERWLIRDGHRGGRRRKSEGSTADTARKRSERPWTASRTMEVLRRCPLAIAQRLVHCAIAVPTAVLGQSHKDNVCCTAVEQQLEAKEVQLSQPSSTSLLMISSGLT